MVVRREAMDQVGLLDEEFYVYSEEVDWCYRFREAGYPVYYFPAAQILHKWEGTWSKLSSTSVEHRCRTRIRLNQAQLRFFRKHYGLYQWSLLKVLIVLANFVRLIWWGVIYMTIPSERSDAHTEATYAVQGLRKAAQPL